jgi:hypothetical protein
MVFFFIRELQERLLLFISTSSIVSLYGFITLSIIFYRLHLRSGLKALLLCCFVLTSCKVRLYGFITLFLRMGVWQGVAMDSLMYR